MLTKKDCCALTGILNDFYSEPLIHCFSFTIRNMKRITQQMHFFDKWSQKTVQKDINWCETRTSEYACLIPEFTSWHPRGARWKGLITFSVTEGYYFALNHFTLMMCPPVFKASFKENKLVDRIWRHARKWLTTVQQHTEPRHVEDARGGVRVGAISKLNSKHRNICAKPSTSSPVGQIKDARTRKLLSTHTKALVLHCGELGCKGDCCFSEASV